MSNVAPGDISINDYNYHLPDEKIALFPLKDRDQSKLLIYKKGEMIGRTLKTEKARSSTLVLDSDNCNFEKSQSNKLQVVDN